MRETKISNIKKSVVTYIIVSMFLLISIVFFSFNLNTQYNQHHMKLFYLKEIDKNIQRELNHFLKDYTYHIQRIIQTTNIVQMLQTEDRKGMFELLKPRFDFMQLENKNVTIMHVHLSDGHSFLRVHSPQKYGDNIATSRAMLQEIHKNHKMIYGYETGNFATVYRIILPIFDVKKKYLGAIEIGIAPQYFIDSIYKINGFSGIFFAKDRPLKLLDKTTIIDGYQLQSEINIDKNLKKIMQKFVSHKHFENNIVINVDEKTYLTYILTLQNFKQEDSVKIVFFEDITDIEYYLNNTIYQLYLLVILIFFILSFLIYRRITLFQNEVSKIYDEQISQLKQSENRYITERNKLRNIFTAMQDGVYIVDKDYNIEYVNDILIKDFGDYSGKKCYQYFHGRDSVCDKCKNDRVQNGETIRWEYFSEINAKTYDLIDTPLYNDDGTIFKLEIFRDITQQKLLEDKIFKLKQQFEQFMEFMPASIIIKESDIIIYANSLTNNFFHVESIVGKTVDELFSKERAKKIKAFEKKAYEDGFNEEIIVIQKDSKELIYRNMAFVIENKEIKQLGIVSIDITKEYKANKEIKRVLSAFERSNISVLITNLAGDIQYVNPSWCRVTGYSKEELLGKNPRIVKSGAISSQDYKKMWEELTSGRVWNSELKNRAKDGSEFWEDSTIMPSFDTYGTIDGYIAFKLEISDKMRMREEIKAQEELMIIQSRHAAMGEMISMIAHQWRQPISVIAMDANNVLVDIELDSLENDSLKVDITDILKQVKYLSKTIDDFRDFFKPAKIKDEVLISDIFIESFSVIAKSLENNNIEVENHFHTKIKVFIYSRELLQVIINILKNAKEALLENRENSRKIINKVYEENQNIVITICDNAGGIDNSVIERIFDPYFTTKDEINGTGIGLYMSKTIIEKHFNGSLEAYNRVDDGVCFKIKFPIVTYNSSGD